MEEIRIKLACVALSELFAEAGPTARGTDTETLRLMLSYLLQLASAISDELDSRSGL